MPIGTQQVLSSADIKAAVIAGVLTQQQADSLLEFGARRVVTSGQADEENLRLVSSFNDIFVVIGIVLFIGALSFLTYESTILNGLLLAAASWGLAEYFTRIRRLALPSIVLLLVFSGSVFWSAIHLLDQDAGSFLAGANETAAVVAGLITTVAVFVHWLRFQVPITVAAGAAALVVTLTAGFGAIGETFFERWANVIFCGLGIVVFLLAMFFDASDRERMTRRTDIAFWLHLLAAPLIVHPVVWPLVSEGTMTNATALAIVLIFLVLGVIALVADRRALLVSSLSYLIYASTHFLSQMEWQSSASAVAVMLVGATVLILSVAWRPFRGILLRILPPVITTRVPVAT